MEVSQSRATQDVNPPYGEKSSFRKLTVTLPQDIYEKLTHESSRRKIAGEPNHLLSSLLREAINLYMATLESTTEYVDQARARIRS